MKIKNPLLVVKDMEKAKSFYRQVLGLCVIADLGANVVLTGGLSQQTEESFMMFTGKDISYQWNDAEIYFQDGCSGKNGKKVFAIRGILYGI